MQNWRKKTSKAPGEICERQVVRSCRPAARTCSTGFSPNDTSQTKKAGGAVLSRETHTSGNMTEEVPLLTEAGADVIKCALCIEKRVETVIRAAGHLAFWDSPGNRSNRERASKKIYRCSMASLQCGYRLITHFLQQSILPLNPNLCKTTCQDETQRTPNLVG